MATGLHELAFEQLGLFSGAGVAPPATDAATMDWAPLDPSGLSDADLTAVLPRARQVEAPGLAREAARRGLSSVGGGAAREAVTRLIVSNAVCGPGMRVALEAAVELGCRLPLDRIVVLLRDDDPKVREAACRCARGGAEVIAGLIDLLADLHSGVACEAALALGRQGRPEGRRFLVEMPRSAPSEKVVRALACIARDDDCVLLGQAAMRTPDLAGLVLTMMDESEDTRATAVARGIRRRRGI